MARPIRNRNRDRLLGLCPKPPTPSSQGVPATKQPILTSFDFKETDAFISEFEWAEYNNPRGRLEDPALLDYDYLKDNYDRSLAREYTINKTLSLTGKEQVARLKFILPDDIPEEKRDESCAAVAKWAIEDKGYALPDLRAMQYIYDHYEEAETTTNPKLFSDMKDCCEAMGDWIYPFFIGSVVRLTSGYVVFPAMEMGVARRRPRGGRLRNLWRDDTVLLVFNS